jgi:hypothetical protein
LSPGHRHGNLLRRIEGLLLSGLGLAVRRRQRHRGRHRHARGVGRIRIVGVLLLLLLLLLALLLGRRGRGRGRAAEEDLPAGRGRLLSRVQSAGLRVRLRLLLRVPSLALTALAQRRAAHKATGVAS